MANDPPQPIAIIGSACRLPGNASSPSKLWALLLSRKEILKDVPPDRFHWQGIYRPDGLHNSSRTKSGYWLEENIRLFDAAFFGINPAEAETMDPQHRLLLENIYEAIESAGLTLEELQGTDAGVFVGMMGRGYYDNAYKDIEASSGPILSTGTGRAMASNRISYAFDFRGPSMTLDTACSSSMMAVHLAVASLRTAESTIAFACGTHLNLNANDYITLTKMNMISADGRSKMFDETADGYGRGEGVGVVCLKRLDAAIRDGNHIECVIRETGTNQDGRTRGITVPNAEAQAALIRKTYKSAGLDPSQVGSRPSYFEAHGTGTYVGDPLEAEAVASSFFPPTRKYSKKEALYIGSVKTILGHTESTAGIAGLLRAALAVPYGYIPPNLHYARMNPNVARFAKHLRVATAPILWPKLPAGCPRRASINSFGFGGSNVHVIVESYDKPLTCCLPQVPGFAKLELVFTPFTFSAASEKALISLIERYLQYLEFSDSIVSLRDLAFTLQYKRSQFPFRYAVTAETREALCKQLRKAVTEKSTMPFVRAIQISRAHIMGIFTGQGAQWAGMGKDLIERSSYAREIIGTLDDHLSSLPEADRPSWKILEELSISPSLSRLGEAEIAQPLTAALQMLLVDLLRVAGVRLNSVVGHSSGEIAAAYAAGLITAKDAIRVAYYRGLHSSHASAVDGKPGAMVATALTAEQAIQFCNSSVLEGRVVPAAFTGPGFVTLSGDADIIDRAILMLDTQNIRATKLKVDKAYHSFHMLPCVDPYRRSLSQCQAGRTRPSRQSKDSPIWFSSVYPGERFDADKGPDLSYWADNLLSPVQFSEAITTALPEMGTPDICLELGPGATLKSPISRILSDAGTNGKPYIGLLNRGSDSLITISEALGQLWTRLGRNAVNFAQYDQTYWNAPQPKLLKDLPTYPWQHDKEYWWQNRLLRRRTKNKHAPSELLGEEMSMGAKHQAQWRRFLRSKNIPWLLDHKIDCIPIFPGAAYVSMAVSASQRIFDGQAIELIEVEDVQFKGPITFPGHASDVEITFTVKNIRSTSKLGQADFIADFCSDQHQNELTTAALGRLSVHFGTDNDRAYPQSMKRCAMLTDVDPSLFYATLSRQGYGYTGPFRAITKLCRRLDFSTGIIAIPPSEMTFHPALLDALLQSTFAAECYAGDSAIFDMRVPSRIRSIKVFPARFSELSTLNSTDVKFDTVKTGNYEYDGLLYATPGIGAIIQMEGLRTSPLRLPTPEDDLKMFSNIVWRPYLRDARALAPDCTVAAQDPAHTVAVERVSFFILRTLNETISPDEEQQAEEPLNCLLQFARSVVNEVTLGLRPHIAPAWVKDTDEDIAKILSDNRHMADMLLLEAFRMAYPRIIRGEVATLSVLTDDDRLAKLYANGPGFHEANVALSNVVSRITCGSQGIRILEVGAGTGGATGGILASATYSSYTYTDVSPAFFARAKEKFAEFTDKIAFSLLDLEKEFAAQGYEPGSFEVIVASNVLHALDNLPTALAQLRQLLKSGGYLACIELPTSSLIGTAVIFGGLPGWGAGKRAGRSSWSPALTDQQWDVELKNAGFTGLDCITPIEDELRIFYRVFVSQALDSRITTLRDPFKTDLPLATENIMIIGDHAASHGSYVDAVGRLLSCSFREIVRLPRLEDLRPDASVPRAVLCLTDLEEPVFGNMTEVKWSAFRKLLTEATDILWVTKGCKYPTKTKAIYSHMMTGLVRSVRHEIPDLRFRMLDIDDTDTVLAKRVAQVMLEWSLLRVFTAGGWRDEVLFPHDTELAIGNGALWVQRPELARSESDRYNSQRRLIVEEVAPHETPIELARSPTAQGYDIRATLQNAITGQGSQFVSVKMIYSTVYAIKVKSIGFAFIGVGVTGDNKRAVVLSRRLSSVVVVQKDELYPLPRFEDLTPELVHTIAADIVAEHIVASAWARGKILVLASDALSVSSIRRMANEHHIEVVFVTGDPDFQAPDAVFIHQNALDIHVRQSLPDDICLFANFSNHASDVALFERVTSILYTANGKVKGFNSFFRGHAYGYDALRREHKATAETAKHLKGPWNTTFSGDGDSNPETLSAVAVAQNGPRDAFTILDWTASNRVSIRVQPATDAVKFAANKTYMIIGSSDLATSLGEWMINSGARHIVMGSRDPSRAAGWAHDMRSKGAYVDLQPVDVTDTDFVKSFFNTIRSQPNKQGTVAPPISGVIHLGLGLKDTVFANMTLDDFHRATDVKTKGSLNLHSHLLEEKLDFFILTSSISYIVGNPGQANYNAGNAFMTGLAHYRRNIGLPASVVHLGPVIGIGYFSREFSQPETGDTLRKLGLYPLSERDLQHIYAEAILASPVDSGRHPEIICGLREIEPDVVDKGLLGKESRAAHLLTRGVASGANLSEESKGQFFVHESVGGMLPSYDQQHSSSATAATSSAPKNLSARDSALRPVIQKALMDRLSALIQMDAKDIDPGASLLVLGIDSLVASEIGTWMKKEFKVQVPQSVIFGGANLNRIVEFVAEKLEEGKADGGEEGK